MHGTAMNASTPFPSIRIGQGYDVHAFGEGGVIAERGDLVLRGVQLQPEELAAMNQRLAAHGYEARAQEGTLLVRTQDRP